MDWLFFLCFFINSIEDSLNLEFSDFFFYLSILVSIKKFNYNIFFFIPFCSFINYGDVIYFYLSTLRSNGLRVLFLSNLISFICYNQEKEIPFLFPMLISTIFFYN